MDAWDTLFANSGGTDKDAWDLLQSVKVVENNSPVYVNILNKTSATVAINEDAKVVTVKGGSRPNITVSYNGGRGPIWLPGNTYDGTSLAAILAGYIGKAQLAQDLLADIDSTITGLVDARAELATAIQTNINNGTRIDDVVSRITQAEDTLELSVAKLNAAESNISNAQVFIDDASVRLSAAEGSISNASNYIATQETILSNEWTVKIQENSDGTACVAGTGLLVYPTWKLDTVYDIDDYSWFDGNAYKAVIAHTASEENVPPNSSYWQLIPYATKSQFGVLAESFFVQTGTGEKAIPFIVQDDQVMINGDLTVNGLINAGALSANKIWTWSIQSKDYVTGTSGYMINALTGHAEFNDLDLTINYSSIIDAPDTSNLIQTALDNTLDTTEGGLIVRDYTLQRYAHLTGGDLEFYDYYDSAWHLYKAVTKNVTGICSDGETVNLGYFREQPTVIVSPYNLQSYAAGYPSQSQTFILGAENLRKLGNNWFFDAIARLNLSPGVTVQIGGSDTQLLPNSTGSGVLAATITTGSTVSVSVMPPSITMPPNTRQVSVSLLVRQQYSFSYLNYKYQVPVAVNIEIQYLSGGVWVTGSTATLTGVNCLSIVERNASLSFSLSTSIESIRIVATFISYSGSLATSIDRYTPIYNTMFAEILQVTSQQEASVISASGYASYMAIG